MVTRLASSGFIGLAVDAAKKRAERLRKILGNIDIPRRPSNSEPFRSALVKDSDRGRRAALIVEYKRCAPGRTISNINPWRYVEIVAEHASAFSVLVEPYWFCGSSQLIPIFASTKPVLYKDFIVDEIQIADAAYWGASAVLLIFEALTWEMLDALYTEARRLGLDVLIEANRASDAVDIAFSYTDALIGLNARNLETLDLSIERLIGEIRDFREKAPETSFLIAESGIRRFENYCQVVRAGADAALIGTAIMLDPNVASIFRRPCE